MRYPRRLRLTAAISCVLLLTAALVFFHTRGKQPKTVPIDAETANAATAAYLSGLSPFCTEECLTSVGQNRQLSQLDSLAEQHDCTFVPKKVTVSAPDESHVATLRRAL